MSQSEDTKEPKSDPRSKLAPEESLPEVVAPGAGFLLQLFLIPMVIVSIIVMVWLMFSWLAQMGNDPADLVASLQKGSNQSWQDAATLADLLRDFAVIALIGLLAWRIRQVRRIVGQYPWLVEKAGPLNWRER